MKINWKSSLLTVASILLVSFSFSQVQPAYDKKIIKDPDGTIYWPLSLPSYIHLSANGQTNDGVLVSNVRDSKMKSEGLPLRWDGPGIHYLRHLGTNGEVAYPVFVDGAAPFTTLTLKGAPSFSSSKLYFGKGLIASLSAKDDMSKVGDINFSVNGESYRLYQSSIKLGEEKGYSIKYFSTDRVGNSEVVKSKLFLVDTTAPVTSHGVTVDHVNGQILSPRSIIELSSEDNLSGVKYIKSSFDTNGSAIYNGKISLVSLPDGEHSLNYSSTDNVDNIESAKLFSFYLDKLAPTVSATIDTNYVIANGKTYISKNSLITLRASDNKAGVKEIYYSVNDGLTQTYSSPFPIAQKQGTFFLKYRAIDNVNNTGNYLTDEKTKNIFLDDTPPKISYKFIGPKFFNRDSMFISGNTTIALNNADFESGAAKIEYGTATSESILYDKPFLLKKEGVHTIRYSGFDKVNNVTTKAFTVIVDSTPPKLFWHFSLREVGSKNGIPIFPVGTTLYLAATDDTAGTNKILFKDSQHADTLYASPIPLLKKGENSLSVLAIDFLGNTSERAVLKFIIK